MCPQWDTSQKENETTHGLAPFANSARAKSNEHAILLMKYLQLKKIYGWSLSNLVALLRQQLFVYAPSSDFLVYDYFPPC